MHIESTFDHRHGFVLLGVRQMSDTTNQVTKRVEASLNGANRIYGNFDPVEYRDDILLYTIEFVAAPERFDYLAQYQYDSWGTFLGFHCADTVCDNPEYAQVLYIEQFG